MVKVKYMHSSIKTLERTEIIRDLRLGVFDVVRLTSSRRDWRTWRSGGHLSGRTKEEVSRDGLIEYGRAAEITLIIPCGRHDTVCKLSMKQLVVVRFRWRRAWCCATNHQEEIRDWPLLPGGGQREWSGYHEVSATPSTKELIYKSQMNNRQDVTQNGANPRYDAEVKALD